MRTPNPVMSESQHVMAPDSGSRLLLQPRVGYFKSHDVKSFDPRRSLRSHFVSVAKRRFTVTGCHKYPFDARKSRWIPVRFC